MPMLFCLRSTALETHWKGERRTDFLTEGIAELTRQVVSLGIKRIAIPRWNDGPGMSWSHFKKLLLCSMARIPNVRFVVCPSIEPTTTLKQISIFTDGAAEPNPGPGRIWSCFTICESTARTLWQFPVYY